MITRAGLSDFANILTGEVIGRERERDKTEKERPRLDKLELKEQWLYQEEWGTPDMLIRKGGGDDNNYNYSNDRIK